MVARGIRRYSSLNTPVDSKAHLGLLTSTGFRATKHPVVLCHGLFGYDVIKVHPILFQKPPIEIRYWNVIENALRKLGCKVHTARVGTVSSLRQRAHQLHEFVESKLAGQKVNFVGHSMGGLDSRYLISHIPDRSYDVKSLTTVATPHRGSSFMDWVKETIKVGCISDYARKEKQDVVLRAFDIDFVESGGKRNIIPPIDLLNAPAFTNLTSEYCTAFNKVTPNDENVYYCSYAAVTHVPALAPLHFSYKIIRDREGENDGLVSLESAQWGDFITTVNCDHWELIPPKLRSIGNNLGIRQRHFDSVEFYLQIVTDLANKGL
ncbi:Alpha/Beta hydrolase protein [Gorgonomyces haynaldii]|nr:Alpha/Beta hydrolase protein [Gorgonomyces haynaldii]